MRARTAVTERATSESSVRVALNLDGTGQSRISTGVGFYDHMLTALSKHSLIDLVVEATGDVHIDGHHVVEDTAIVIGQALREALGDKRGIRRYGACHLAMDDALVRAALDLSGRAHLVWKVDFPTAKIGTFDTELVREFFTAFAMNGGVTLNVAFGGADGRDVYYSLDLTQVRRL